MRPACFLFVIALFGCAADEPATPTERLVGAWTLRAGACLNAMVFDGAGEYETRYTCSTSSPFEVQLTAGDFSATDDELTLEPLGEQCGSNRGLRRGTCVAVRVDRSVVTTSVDLRVCPSTYFAACAS